MPARNCSRSKRDQSTPIASPTRFASSVVVRCCSVMSPPPSVRENLPMDEAERYGGAHGNRAPPPGARALAEPLRGGGGFRDLLDTAGAVPRQSGARRQAEYEQAEQIGEPVRPVDALVAERLDTAAGTFAGAV